MRKLLLNPTPLFRKLRQLSMLLTLLLALPAGLWAQGTKTFNFYGATDNIIYCRDENNFDLSWTYQTFQSGYYGASTVDTGVKITVRDNDGKSLLSAPDGDIYSSLVDKISINYADLTVTEGSKIYLRAVNRTDTTTHYSAPCLMTNSGTLEIDFASDEIRSENLALLIFSNDKKAYSYILSNITFTLIDYKISIAGVALTGENVGVDGSVTGVAGIYGNVSYDATTNTLTLNGATINGGIVYSGAGNLTIALKGTNNNIGDNITSIATGISSTNNGTLTFTVDGSGGSLSINTTTSAVSGFADVTLGTGTYLNVGTPTKYDTNGKNFREQIGSANIVKVMQITSQAYYPLWVRGTQVSHLTSATDLTFTAATNTLALSNAWIATGIISGLDNLIITLTGNNNIQLDDTTAAIRSINPAATLTIQKSASAENGSLNMKNRVDDASSSPVIKNFASVSHTGLNFVSKTGTTLEAATVHDAVLSSAEIYPLWIGGTLVTAATHSFNGTSGTIDYSSETNTLTLTGYQNTFATGHAIETGIVGLKVKLVGDNYITCQDNSGFAFYTQQSTASVQFTKVDATSKLRMTTNGNPISGFGDGKVTFDGLVYYSSGGSEKYITQPKAPTLGWEMNDEKGQSYTYATIKYALTDRVGGVESGALFYASQNPVLKYSFDYANDAIADVTDETYPAGGIKMIAPGKLTAWVEVGTAKSEESKGVRFGILENPIEMEFNGTSKEISITPAPTMTNAVTPSVNSDYTALFNSFATLDATNNKITINSCYDGMIGFTFTNTDGGYTSLNDTTKITFNVTPPKPTISVPGGTYDAAQTVSIVSNYQGTGATIKYYFDPTAEQTYSADLSITETKTLTAWVEVNGVKSDTVQAPYTIRQAANLSYSATSATANIHESSITFTPPTLSNPSQVAVTYSSSNTAVATINTTGDVTIVGAGVTTISAKPTDETLYIPTPATYELTVTRDFNNPFANQPAEQIYATYYNVYEDLTLPDGIAAYVITGLSGNTVTTTATGYLPHEVPILLEKTGNVGTTITGYTGSAGNFSGNLLKYADQPFSSTGKEYVLYMNEFVKATGNIPDSKCYLDLSSVNPSRGMYGIGDGTTSIRELRMENEGRDEWYDLQGRRIEQPTKAGLYIKNGKKVIVNIK